MIKAKAKAIPNAKAEDKRQSNELFLFFEWPYVHNFIRKRL